MTTLELANRALRILGEPKLSSFADNGSVSAVINDLFEQTFNLMLKEEDWYWARKRAELVEDTLLTHYSEWEYVFDLPTDLLQIRSVTNQIKEEIPYEVEQGHLFTNFPAFTDADGNNYPRMLYTAKVLDSGSVEPDLLSGYADTMTPEFEKAFAARLALEACMTVTKDQQMLQTVRGEYFLSLQRAAQLNAIAQPGFGAREYDDWSDPVEGGGWRSNVGW